MNLKIRLPSLNGDLAAYYCLEKGNEEPTIIFLHESLGCIETWRDFPKELAQKTNYNYLVYDRLGYGASSRDKDALKRNKEYLHKEADILIEIINHLHIKKPILFGHSDGGSIALIAASKSTGSIRGIILEGAHVFVEPITLEGIRKMRKYFQTRELRAKLAKYHDTKVDDVFASWADTWLDSSFQNWNIESYLPAISCPCLILQGAKDEYGSIEQVKRIESGIKGKSKTVILENVGHNPHKEDKARTLEMTSNFINQLNLK